MPTRARRQKAINNTMTNRRGLIWGPIQFTAYTVATAAINAAHACTVLNDTVHQQITGLLNSAYRSGTGQKLMTGPGRPATGQVTPFQQAI